MPEQKINQLNTKFATMQEKVENLVCQNTKEHDAIFTKLDEISHLINEQNCKADERRLEYSNCFATKKDLDKISLEVEKIKTKILLGAGAVSVVVWLLNHYDIKLLN